MSVERKQADWTFLSNHAHVILCISLIPEFRIRDIAERIGITERAVQRIIANLVEAGYINKTRNGRRNVYKVRKALPLRHPIEKHRTVSDLINLILKVKK